MNFMDRFLIFLTPDYKANSSVERRIHTLRETNIFLNASMETIRKDALAVYKRNLELEDENIKLMDKVRVLNKILVKLREKRGASHA